MRVSKIENCSEVCRRDSLWISQDDACKSRIHVAALCPIWSRSQAGILGKLMIVAQTPNSRRTPWILGDIQRSYVAVLAIFRFTTTERILASWLVESYGLWQYRPWKWRNISEKLRRKLKINVIIKNKSTTIFHGLHSYRPQKWYHKILKTLQWNHSPAARGSTWVLNISWRHFCGL